MDSLRGRVNADPTPRLPLPLSAHAHHNGPEENMSVGPIKSILLEELEAVAVELGA
jgi:hypothetical protein